ncbi:MAG TPA: hypothetical protein VMD92_05770 [Acidobacteriaceae bacterium]|jgi:hypothetical protein|nr:hypothetical protein [Acidobacteriaceae bacterium]
MRITRYSLPLAVLAVAGMLAMGGCGKKSNQQASIETPAQSAAQPGAQSAAQPAAQPGSAAPAQPAQPTPPPPLTIPPGTRIRVRLDQAVGSKISVAGQAFRATVADDVVVNGQTVIAQGADAVGTVIAARPLGHVKGGALLELRLDRVTTASGSYPVATSTMERTEKGKGKRTAKFAGGGGAFGAIIGGLAGGGKGALVGALAGAGAGTAGSAVTGNKEIYLPTETLITFRLEKPVQVAQ